MSDTQQLVQDVVEAIDRLPWAQWCKQKMAAEMPPGAGQANPVAGPGAGEPAAPPIAGAGGAGPTGSPLAPPAPKPEPPKPEMAKPEAPKPPEEPKKDAAGAGDGSADAEGKEKEEYARLHKGYMADEQYQRYSALKKKYGGDADDEYRETPKGSSNEKITVVSGDGKPASEKKDYAAGAGGSNDGSDPEKPGQATVEGNLNPAGTGTAGNDGGTTATHYSREGEPERFERQQREITSLRQQVADERKTRINGERYSRLQALRLDYSFDLEKAVEILQYEKATDEQFKAHVEFIQSSGRPIPLGEKSRALDEAVRHSEPVTTNGTGRAIAQRYSLEHSNRAFRICEARATLGKTADYQQVLESIAAGQEPKFPD